jgi:site-specific recombinase XerD
MAALPALVSGLDAEMTRLGYKDSTMVWYRGAWRRMQRYFAAREAEEFSLDLAMAWVDEACGFFAKEQAGTLKQTDVYLFRVAQMLSEYEVHGAVLRRYSRTVSKLAAGEAAPVARFEAWLRAAGRSSSTVRSYGTLAGEFAKFAGTRGGLAGCDAGTVGAFVATLAGYQVKTVEQKLCALRSFLRFASEQGLTTSVTAEAVPAVPSRKQARIPSVWDPGDVARILAAVDRGSPCGKRDYAIILLVTRLGLRTIDVKRLEFSDFDWPGNRLSVAQAKTGRRVQLPLLRDVGWAVIDYVRDGRPASGCPQVFLRHTAPVGPFSEQDHLHQILVKHARAAHVPVREERRHGMHSLRHALATRLMEDGTPVEQIADILGHQSVASTGVYLKSSLGLLARCALDPDEPAGGQASR